MIMSSHTPLICIVLFGEQCGLAAVRRSTWQVPAVEGRWNAGK
jgi:hypothetical protein